jgi:small subunit ribosomal protein S6
MSAIGMEKTNMALYEHVFLARQDLAQAQVDTMAQAATDIVTGRGGRVTKTETWGLRSLAYRIAKNRKAHYVMLEIDAPGDTVAELERQAAINEDIIRYMTVRIEEGEAGPSVMMRKQERDRERRAIAKAPAVTAETVARRAAARRRWHNGAPVFPPPQVLPVLGQGRAAHRLQGRAPAAGLRVRARQDRAVAHHQRVGQEAARARPGDQARAPSGPAALCREVRE